MSFNLNNITLTIFLFTTIIVSSYALRCHDCAGPIGKNLACEVDLDNEHVQVCPNDWICAKFIVNHEGKPILNRRCEKRDICDTLDGKYDEANNPNQLSECFTCNTDLCNSSSVLVPSILSIILLAAWMIR